MLSGLVESELIDPPIGAFRTRWKQVRCVDDLPSVDVPDHNIVIESGTCQSLVVWADDQIVGLLARQGFSGKRNCFVSAGGVQNTNGLPLGHRDFSTGPETGYQVFTEGSLD